MLESRVIDVIGRQELLRLPRHALVKHGDEVVDIVPVRDLLRAIVDASSRNAAHSTTSGKVSRFDQAPGAFNLINNTRGIPGRRAGALFGSTAPPSVGFRDLLSQRGLVDVESGKWS